MPAAPVAIYFYVFKHRRFYTAFAAPAFNVAKKLSAQALSQQFPFAAHALPRRRAEHDKRSPELFAAMLRATVR